MKELNFKNISIDGVLLPLFLEKRIEVSVLRLDKIHPVISGNKWFKLRYYLEEAKNQNKKNIITFGGAWSNHLLATAAACRLSGFKCTGIIRGEEAKTLSSTLILAKEMGMQLLFTSREDYRKKIAPEYLSNGEHYFINEGGYGEKGAEGAAGILEYFQKEDYTHICCAVGTGTMAAGLIKGSSDKNTITGVSVLKNNTEPDEKIGELTGTAKSNYRIFHDYHWGGYARYRPELIEYMNLFFSQTKIPTDFVYTGKLFYAVNDLAQNDFFSPGSRLLIIHSGGLQGNASLKKGTLLF